MALMVFVLGLLIGSFLNVCIYRIPAGKSIVYPPSSCGSCHRQLKGLDLIPVLTYFFYKGKCRYCGKAYSIQYPMVELMNGLLYVWLFYRFGLSLIFVFYSIVASLLLVISFIDIETKTIPDGLNIFAYIIAIGFGVFAHKDVYLSMLYGFLFGFLFFFIIAVVTNAMGGGDIKLMGALGIAFGLSGVIFVTILSFIYGSIISIGLLVSKKAGRKTEIPFGPFISFAALTFMLYGQEILDLYFAYIGIK